MLDILDSTFSNCVRKVECRLHLLILRYARLLLGIVELLLCSNCSLLVAKHTPFWITSTGMRMSGLHCLHSSLNLVFVHIILYTQFFFLDDLMYYVTIGLNFALNIYRYRIERKILLSKLFLVFVFLEHHTFRSWSLVEEPVSEEVAAILTIQMRNLEQSNLFLQKNKK